MSVHACSFVPAPLGFVRLRPDFGDDGGRVRRDEATVKTVGDDEDDGRCSHVCCMLVDRL